jgi:hypothetical protein
MPAKVLTYFVRRLTTDEYSVPPNQLAEVLNNISKLGGTITQIVSCSSIRPIEGSGYFWLDIIYTMLV